MLYSFGLENALERAKTDISFFLTNVYEAATRVCVVVKDEFSQKSYLPYLPDTNFVMCSYALLSLLKLLKPELQPYHDSEEAIFKLVSLVFISHSKYRVLINLARLKRSSSRVPSIPRISRQSTRLSFGRSSGKHANLVVVGQAQCRAAFPHL